MTSPEACTVVGTVLAVIAVGTIFDLPPFPWLGEMFTAVTELPILAVKKLIRAILATPARTWRAIRRMWGSKSASDEVV